MVGQPVERNPMRPDLEEAGRMLEPPVFIIQQLIDSLPQVAAAIAGPLSRTERIVVINSGGDGAGASRVTQDIANIVAQVPATVEALTGVNVIEMIKNLQAVQGAQAGQEQAQVEDEGAGEDLAEG